jgi:hypothetical protein
MRLPYGPQAASHRSPLTGAALIVLGVLIAVSAVLGPLVMGIVRFHTSESAVAQLVGGEVISLILVAPMAIVAGVLWMRGSPLAPVLALGPSAYSLYMYVQYVVGAQYERYPGNNEYFFPLYLALIILAWAAGISAWHRLTTLPLPPLGAGIQRALGMLMLVLNITFALAWLSSIYAVLAGSHESATWVEYQKDQTLFWLIRMMDLGFVIPASFVVSIGLLRSAPWATRLAYAFLGFQTLIVAAVAGMAIVMSARSDLAASPILLIVTVVLTIALGGMFYLLLRTLILLPASTT